MVKPSKGKLGMHRLSVAAAALLLLTTSAYLHALGLGEIDMQSTLNQPMNAAIELTSSASTDLSTVSVTLASQAAHQRIGLSRSRILNDFDFTVVEGTGGNAIVRVTSRNAVQEPFLEFLLELSWPNGRLLREYTVLVDPPITMPATPAKPVTPVSRAPASTTRAPQTQRPTSQPATAVTRSSASLTADSYGPIRRNETLWSIAEQLRPGRDISTHQMMLALQRKNPQAFEGNNINNLKAGVTLAVPTRSEIESVSAAEAFAETKRQYSEWHQGAAEEPPAVATEDVSDPANTEVASTGTGESRLQLMAPDLEAVEGAATSGDPMDVEGEAGSSESLNQQLALANEEAAASKAQTAEYQSQVSELEEQVETMKRLLELKDEELASMQQRLATEVPDETVVVDSVPSEDAEITDQAMETAPEAVETEELPVAEDVAVAIEEDTTPRNLVNTLMDNPLLAGLGALVALVLGGVLLSFLRRKRHAGLFDDELTLEKQMELRAGEGIQKQVPQPLDVEEQEPDIEHQVVQGTGDEGDPLTEADVYLAYGRIQQAEDVLQAALASSPDDNAIRLKLLEVYHAAGNATAFDREASDFRDGVTEEDAMWMQVASMGYAMSPDNNLYRAAAMPSNDVVREIDMDSDAEITLSEQSMDAGQPEAEIKAEDLPESIEFTLDDDEEDASEGMLDISDEVTTKLDLARAYLDMGDPEGARSILGEVMEEGNDEQKNEAEALISKLA
jgi:pilus assembly protein FimV